MHDHRVAGGTSLDRVEPRHRLRVGRVGAQAVDGFGGKSDEAAGAEDLRGAAHLGVHSFSGAALSTALACFLRNSDNFLCNFASDSARTATMQSRP